MSLPICTRRAVFQGIAGAAGCTLSGSIALGNTDRASETLGGLAAAKRLLFGSAMMTSELTPVSKALFAREVLCITPSNELKMHDVRPTPEVVDFSGADALIAFAEQYGWRIRGHNLIWNEWQPEWVHRLSKAEIAGLIDRHIDEVMGRYCGRIFAWDVVNEPIGTERGDAEWLSNGPYFAALGKDYIARSFRRARAADPSAKLFINETHTERDDWFGLRCRKRLLQLIDELQHAGVPLDGIGIQGHLEPPAPFERDAFLAFCGELASRGLEIHITELDVRDDAFPDDIAARDAAVAGVIYSFLHTALACTAVQAVATWHLADPNSYAYRLSVEREPRATRRPRPLLFDERQLPKPAWHAVRQAFAEMPIRR